MAMNPLCWYSVLVHYFSHCCDQIPGRNNLSGETYLNSWFHWIQSMIACTMCLDRTSLGMGWEEHVAEELLHHVVDRKERGR
jgi:hypothetical protein